MNTKMLILVGGSDLESTKRDVLKIVDPEGASTSGDGEVKLSKADNIARLEIDLDYDNMHFMIPMNIFEGVKVGIEHGAARALMNPIDVQGKKYVFLNDGVARLAAKQCAPTT
jgi:hypothetical protein